MSLIYNWSKESILYLLGIYKPQKRDKNIMNSNFKPKIQKTNKTRTPTLYDSAATTRKTLNLDLNPNEHKTQKNTEKVQHIEEGDLRFNEE